MFHFYVAWFLRVLITCGLSYHLQDANSKLRKGLESERKFNEEEKGILRTRNEEMQHELEALKVSVAYIHQVYSSIRSYCSWHARGHVNVNSEPAVVHLA